MRILGGIQIRAVGIALFAFYVAPILPLIVLSSMRDFVGGEITPGERTPLWQEPFVFVLAWFYAFAPVGCGYFAAKLAGRQPLLHGLAVGLVGGLLVTFFVHSAIFAFEVVAALFVASCGLFGGWLGRHRGTERNRGP